MNDNKEIITKNEKFEIVLIGCKEKELPKNLDGREYFYECIINFKSIVGLKAMP